METMITRTKQIFENWILKWQIFISFPVESQIFIVANKSNESQNIFIRVCEWYYVQMKRRHAYLLFIDLLFVSYPCRKIFLPSALSHFIDASIYNPCDVRIHLFLTSIESYIILRYTVWFLKTREGTTDPG